MMRLFMLVEGRQSEEAFVDSGLTERLIAAASPEAR